MQRVLDEVKKREADIQNLKLKKKQQKSLITQLQAQVELLKQENMDITRAKDTLNATLQESKQ